MFRRLPSSTLLAPPPRALACSLEPPPSLPACSSHGTRDVQSDSSLAIVQANLVHLFYSQRAIRWSALRYAWDRYHVGTPPDPYPGHTTRWSAAIFSLVFRHTSCNP